MLGPSPHYITIRYNKPGSCSLPLREQVGAELRRATAYVPSLIAEHACSRDSSGGLLTTLRTRHSNSRGSTLGRVQTGCRTHPACPSICTGDFPRDQTGRVAKLTSHPILTSGLKINGRISPPSLVLFLQDVHRDKFVFLPFSCATVQN